ncbi:MAG: terpene cyclase/mutase family protein [Gammaproteobacteria bacterium]|nr:terpene cyclase/mutase family protein [Gammaproteobacteria bacterium]
MKTLFKSFLIATLLLPMGLLTAGEMMNPELLNRAKRAADDGLRYLREQQAEDGSWSKSVGVTALALHAYLENRRGYNESDGPFITRPIAFLLSHVNEDGSISETNHNRNYNTAVAITALQATNNPEYAKVIRNGQQFIKGLQLDQRQGYEPNHKYYGGVGYGGDERPDLSNIYMALESLRATSLDSSDPLWEKALVFVSRSQNHSETNDQAWATDDGGFAYMPGYSPHGEAVSYGGMTHAGLLSLLFAGMDRNDPRVSAAYDWIRANYTLETNPGAKKNQGLFYYYNAFAKSMHAYGEPEITDTAGIKHNWRNDLTRRLLAIQEKDGAWINRDSPKWWEGNKNLCTAWVVIALNHVINTP